MQSVQCRIRLALQEAAVHAKTTQPPLERKEISDILDRPPSESRGLGRFFTGDYTDIDPKERYDKVKDSGAGSYGKVWIARDRQCQNRLVAIKEVLRRSKQHEERIAKEVEIMQMLSHFNICKLFGTYTHKRWMYFIMELCTGGEIFDRIEEQALIDENTARDIFRQVASALHYAHTNGVAHRDLNPHNICFANEIDDCVKVIDWGLGAWFGRSPLGKMFTDKGTEFYAGPEVHEAKKPGCLPCFSHQGYTAACDLWSLGVLLYVMLSGMPPFWGTIFQQVSAMKRERYLMNDPVWTVVSGEAKSLIKSLMKANPKSRMAIKDVLMHPWLTMVQSNSPDKQVVRSVLTNMNQFSFTTQFNVLCSTILARHRDQQTLKEIHRVFMQLDTNNDGVLQLEEIQTGFQMMFGQDSEEYKQVADMFKRVDWDKSGTLDFSEFCAASISVQVFLQDEKALFSAFKDFDADDDGCISKAELESVLRSVNVNNTWSDSACEAAAAQCLERYDANGDGKIDYEEFLKLVQEIAHQEAIPLAEKTYQEMIQECSQTVPAESSLKSCFSGCSAGCSIT